jgi:hypothetical protein
VNINGKMMPVETILGIGERGIKDNDGRRKFKCDYLIYFKNLCKCHNVLPCSTTIKQTKKNDEIFGV